MRTTASRSSTGSSAVGGDRAPSEKDSSCGGPGVKRATSRNHRAIRSFVDSAMV
jgi:hypothetical protein